MCSSTPSFCVYKRFNPEPRILCQGFPCQTLTSEVGSTGGNRALGEVHMEVRAEVIKADSDIICKSFVDGPVRILVEANFDGAKVPKIYRQIDPPTDRKTEVEVDAGLDRLGWERTEESFAEVYGDGYQRKPEPKLDPYGLPIGTGPARAPGQQMPQRQPAQRKAREFAAAEFPDQATLDHALDELDNGGGFDSLDGSLKPIFDFLEQHGPQETLARFVEFYALPMRSLQERLARVIFIADVWGRINARE